MKNSQNTTKACPIPVGASSARPFYEEITKNNIKNIHGITLIALVITVLFSYDEKLKCSNSKGFLLATI